MTGIASPVIIEMLAKFFFPSLSVEDVYTKQTRETDIEGRVGKLSNTCIHEPTNEAKFMLCFPGTSTNYVRD